MIFLHEGNINHDHRQQRIVSAFQTLVRSKLSQARGTTKQESHERFVPLFYMPGQKQIVCQYTFQHNINVDHKPQTSFQPHSWQISWACARVIDLVNNLMPTSGPQPCVAHKAACLHHKIQKNPQHKKLHRGKICCTSIFPCISLNCIFHQSTVQKAQSAFLAITTPQVFRNSIQSNILAAWSG